MRTGSVHVEAANVLPIGRRLDDAGEVAYDIDHQPQAPQLEVRTSGCAISVQWQIHRHELEQAA